MTFKIPAKTFLLGEYVALADGPAIVLTTTPCFEVGCDGSQTTSAIHADSPAGQFWRKKGMTEGLTWFDPYGGKGGLGASSAQFLGAYLAYLTKHRQSLKEAALLDAYWASAFKPGEGVRPSGYDVLAQAQSGCVYVNRSQSELKTYAWPFTDIAFVLLHTGVKLATHHHLKDLKLSDAMQSLAPIVMLAKDAFETNRSALLIDAVNAYYQQLLSLKLVASQTSTYVSQLSCHPDVLALKGCGAMGADVLLALVPRERLDTSIHFFSEQGFSVLASSRNLYSMNSKKKSYGMHSTP
ncbi:MAG: hypothetical protein P1U32_03120 [Legionellaceae bacterium]|nr:hypothetical protein [Legionellaceae bacterium]